MAMKDKIEGLLGSMLRKVRSSNEKLTSHQAPAAQTIQISSSAFKPNNPIPKKYTQEAENVSPPLQWTNVPAGAKSLVLVTEDPDAPMPHPLAHWIVYNIPAGAKNLAEGVARGASIPGGGRQSKNYDGDLGYTGPMPPRGHGTHHYHFQLFAVDRELSFNGEPSQKDLQGALQGHVIAEGELVGTYERLKE